MAGLFPNAEEEWLAKQQVNFDGTGTDIVMHLFSNDYTPVDGSTLGSFTECAFTGYAAKTLTGASWTVTAGAPTSATYSTQTFSSSAAQTLSYVYGFYFTRGSSLAYAERFTDAPYNIVGASDYIAVNPALYYKKTGE